MISGAEADVLAVSEAFAAKGMPTKRLTVSHAFHSALMEPMLDEFRRVAEFVAYQPAQIAVVSNVSGQVAGSELSTAEYWVRHVREAVRFAAGVGALHAAGVTEYVELGPRPTLLGLVPACLPAGAKDPVLVASLRPERAESAAALEALGSHFAQGGRVEWNGVFPSGGSRVELPTYAWQRQRYWIEQPLQAQAGEATGHPLLGVRVSFAGGAVVYEAVLSRAEHSWLYDHRVGELALMPGAGVAELVRAAGEHRFDGDAVEVVSLVLQAPLVLPEHGGQRVQVLLREDDDGRTEVSVYSQRLATAEAGWTLHASGEVRRADADGARRIDLAAVRARCGERVEAAQAYEAFASVGLDYGPAFQGLQTLWRGTSEALAEVSLPEGVEGAERYGIHPALLDAAFQSLSGSAAAEKQALHLPFAMERVIVHASGATAAWVHVRRAEQPGGENGAADVTLTDERGDVLVEVIGLRSRPVADEALDQSQEVANALYELGWPASPASPASTPSGRWVVVAAEQDATTEAVVERLRTAGAACERVDIAGLAAALPAEHVVCLWGRPDDEATAAEAAYRMASDGLGMVQLVAKQERAPRLWWVTRGAVAVTAEEPAEVAQASLWGLGRTVMQEHPELDCTLVDVEDGPRIAEAILCELCATDEEREIAWRAGERRVARLRRAAVAADQVRQLRWDGTVLVTGGLGALGLHVARWLAQGGMRHLVLTGRRGLATPGAAAAVEELEALGARVTVAAVDVSDGAAVRALLQTIGSDLPLRGVVHAAGVRRRGCCWSKVPIASREC